MRADTDIVSYGPWRLDVRRRLLEVNGSPVPVQRGAMKLLLYLVSHEHHLVSKDELIEEVWEGRQVSDAAIYNRVSAARKAILDDESLEPCIRWEYGSGLRFARPQTDAAHSPARETGPDTVLRTSAVRTKPRVVSPQLQGALPPQQWRQFLGIYHVIYRTPSWPDSIKIGVSVLKEIDGRVAVWTTEHGEDEAFGIRQRARYQGSAEFIDDRIYIMEQNVKPPRSVCLTALDAPHAYRPDIMTGMMMGSSWRLRGAPYTTRTVWRRVPADMTLRDAIRQSGPRPNGSDDIEPRIRESLGPDCLTFYDLEKTL